MFGLLHLQPLMGLMIYKLLKITEDNVKIYARIDDDNKCRLTCSEENEDFKKWVAEGNTPTPADE
jgi:hypothetical protein